MPTALLSSYTRNAALSDFAKALWKRGWTIIATPATSQFLKKADVVYDDCPERNLMCVHEYAVLGEGLQIGLTGEDTFENRGLFGQNFIDLVVVDCQPISEVLNHVDVDRRPVYAETFRAWAVMAAVVGFRPVVTDLKDLPKVLDWIERDELNGMNLRWLWAKAYTTLAIRMTELAKHISYGTSPSGMLIGIGLPEPNSPEWENARVRAHDVLARR